MIKRITHKYVIGMSALLALAFAGGAGFKWSSCSIVIELLQNLF